MAGKERELGWLSAIISSFLNRTVSRYPRFTNNGGEIEQIPDWAIIEQAVSGIKNLNPTHEELAKYLDRGREVLDEVKGLTEYQDQKATRQLTIIAFLSALSGALYSRFIDSYPLSTVFEGEGLATTYRVLVGITHISFGLFALSAICGAMVTFHATRTRFKYPKLDAHAQAQAPSHPASYLFYSAIIELKPETWASSFTSENGSKIEPNIPLRFFRNYIVESYLVAAKVADKLRYLHPAQDILAFSIRALLIWLILLSVTAVLVPAHDKQKSVPCNSLCPG